MTKGENHRAKWRVMPLSKYAQIKTNKTPVCRFYSILVTFTRGLPCLFLSTIFIAPLLHAYVSILKKPRDWLMKLRHQAVQQGTVKTVTLMKPSMQLLTRLIKKDQQDNNLTRPTTCICFHMSELQR